MSNAVARIEPEAPQSEGATLLAVISRAAADPNTDVDKMERLMAMYERHESRQAAAEFDAALSMMQPELPVVSERGGIKDRNGNVQSTYALWEDINAAIKPVLARHGFALSFRIECKEGITVTGVLTHRAGHREETSITLPADQTGSKNAVQAVASSTSYGKRYTAGALLNLTSHGEDDDAFRAVDPEKESRAQEATAKANEWAESAAAAGTLAELAERKADCLKSYGLADKVPKVVRAAFVKRQSELESAK